jgi:hypothetical protein
MKMARITDGVVGDVIVPIEGFSIEECFHPDVLALYVTVADDVQPGWIVTEDGIVEPNAPEPEPESELESEPEEEAPAEEAPAEEAPAEEAPAEEAPEATA